MSEKCKGCNLEAFKREACFYFEDDIKELTTRLDVLFIKYFGVLCFKQKENTLEGLDYLASQLSASSQRQASVVREYIDMGQQQAAPLERFYQQNYGALGTGTGFFG